MDLILIILLIVLVFGGIGGGIAWTPLLFLLLLVALALGVFSFGRRP